ncbi:MAG: hypothetical protein WC595_04430 [Candidatus Nanoarchaeia archaeon]
MVNPKSLNPFETPQKGSDWSREEVEKRVEEISRGIKKFIQAYNLRVELLEKRMEVLLPLARMLNSNKGVLIPDKVFKKLEWCNRNEKRLMVVIDEAKNPTFEMLVDNPLLKWRGIDEKTKALIELMFKEKEFFKKNGWNWRGCVKGAKYYGKFIKIFYQNEEVVKQRLEFEEAYLANGDLTLLKRYIEIFLREIKAQKKLERLLLKGRTVAISGGVFSIIGIAAGGFVSKLFIDGLLAEGVVMDWERSVNLENGVNWKIVFFVVMIIIGCGTIAKGMRGFRGIMKNYYILKDISKQLKKLPSASLR